MTSKTLATLIFTLFVTHNIVGIAAFAQVSAPDSVDVPALIREVRSKEQWLQDAASFHVTASSITTRSPQAIDVRRLELRKQFRGKPLTAENLPKLLPKFTSSLDLAFTEIKEGAKVEDATFDTPFTYDYKKSRTPAELKAMAAEAKQDSEKAIHAVDT